MEKEKAALSAKKKKTFPFMRLFISFLAGLAALALFWSVYFLTRSTAVPEMADYTGEYFLSSAQNSSLSLDKSAEAAELSLSLTADGRCRLSAGSKTYAGRWSLADGAVKVKCAGVKLEGTISETALCLSNVFSEGLNLKLDKVRDSEEEAEVPSPGTYSLCGVETKTGSYGAAAIFAAGYSGCYVEIAPDGTGEALLFDEAAQEIACTEDFIVYKGMRLSLSSSGKELRLSYPGGVTLIFEK